LFYIHKRRQTDGCKLQRFVYGNKTDFGNATNATQVFRFAHMMEIQALMTAAADFLQENTVPNDVFDVLDMWVFLQNSNGINKCIQVIDNITKDLDFAHRSKTPLPITGFESGRFFGLEVTKLAADLSRHGARSLEE
jgi:hypothetical protein